MNILYSNSHLEDLEAVCALCTLCGSRLPILCTAWSQTAHILCALCVLCVVSGCVCTMYGFKLAIHGFFFFFFAFSQCAECNVRFLHLYTRIVDGGIPTPLSGQDIVF